MLKIASKIAIFLVLQGIIWNPLLVVAETEFNPHFILSDQELQDTGTWTSTDIQKFLDSRGSYLKAYRAEDASGTPKMAADIIYDASKKYNINPKYVLVTLQKEQSLITDDSPTPKQLDWAAGYGVCDACSMDDPKIQKYKGFGNQVDYTAGIMRWYYDNSDKSFIKKKDTPIRIDDQEVTPQSWATAFLYTYTPHLHGNKNFWRIWQAWFQQLYPNGTLALAKETNEYWLIQNGLRRKFKNKSTLVSRIDPKLAVVISEVELNNYTLGTDINFPNYSLLKTASTAYLLDYDALRPFASNEVIRQIGFHPDEFVEVSETDIAGYEIGQIITASTTAPLGVIYEIVDLKNALYLLKDGTLFPITDKQIVEVNYKNLPIEKHKAKELATLPMADVPLTFNDGTLVQVKDSSALYVVQAGKRRRIADEETFKALGYKHANVNTISQLTLANLPEGERLFLNNSLLSSKNKFLGDSAAPVVDAYTNSQVPVYLVAEYPSGRIIAGKGVNTKRPIASLTKLLVAYEALSQNYSFDKTTTYQSDKYATEGNTLKLVNGEKLRNKDIFYSMLVASNNPAARMVAQGTGLTDIEMVNNINERLEEWGADFSAISDVTGLSDANQSSARDLLKIFTKVLANKTIKNTLFEANYSFAELIDKNKNARHKFNHTNQLIAKTGRPYRILASKTGYTEEAGFVLIMLVESRKTKQQYVTITMGDKNYSKRFEEPHKLASWIVSGNVTIAKSE